MRIGQSSAIVFLSKVLGSALGFLATVYFARVLGAEVLGIYFVIITIIAWLEFGGRSGILDDRNKRISEDVNPSEFLAAGAICIAAFGLFVGLAIILFRPYFEAFIPGLDEYSNVSIIWFIIPMLFAQLEYGFTNNGSC